MNNKFNDYVFYHIYPLGFCGAPLRNDFVSAPVERLKKLYDWIEHIKSLGVNALYLGPVFESNTHGYDTADYFNVDRRLGTNETLKQLVSAFHEKGIKIILDGVFNHVGRNFPAFLDLRKNQSNSEFCDWFSEVDFTRSNPVGDSFTYANWNNHYELVKLNLGNNEVKKHIFDAVRMWMNEFQIDGLRLDAADCINISFLQELSRFTKNINLDFLLIGEVIHGDYNKWANKDTLDSVTNYECYKGLYSSHNDINYFEIAYSLNREFGEGGIYRNLPLYNFADNHDVNRIAGQLTNFSHIFPLHLLLFTMPGIPSIYYGSEFAVNGKKTNSSDAALRPALDLAYLYNSGNLHLLNAIKQFSSIRQNSQALRSGDYTQLHISHQQFAFLRRSENETVIVVVNSSEKEAELSFGVPLQNGFCFHDALNSNEKFTVSHNKIHIKELYPNWGNVLIGR